MTIAFGRSSVSVIRDAHRGYRKGTKMTVCLSGAFGEIHKEGNTYRFVEQMNTDTFGTVTVKAGSLREACDVVAQLSDEGKACWKR